MRQYPCHSPTHESSDWAELEHFVIQSLNDLVDYQTGEILTERAYVTAPIHPAFHSTEAFIPPFDSLSSVEQRDRFMADIDKRTLSRFNGCAAIYNEDKGRHALIKAPINFPTRVFKLMNTLVKALDFQNMLIVSIDQAAELLQCRTNHVQRQLQSLGQLVRVCSTQSGMKRGSLKIQINPAYGYRYFRRELAYRRQIAVRCWYRFD
ncbi:hypothetical protein [Larsenimonas suaedae]|uniref:Uncharacterized protein n=1 Tax=Larsenimonas suaedae TaxID=1851019 RepID=A0ABU1GYZ0_9GAMM|nr:hypothetical protein [Larsenimonas suaedae]MCM2973746.1 hypothetical protein [Larsenimonas suaedae]MDR5897270.1 hypothetical protein [Larsenimonas suaedae]